MLFYHRQELTIYNFCILKCFTIPIRFLTKRLYFRDEHGPIWILKSKAINDIMQPSVNQYTGRAVNKNIVRVDHAMVLCTFFLL